MSRNERKRQKALAKKTTKRQQRKLEQRKKSVMLWSDEAIGSWPIHGAWITSKWQEKSLAGIFIIRRQTNGAYAFANFLVDLGCLGLKDTFARINLAWEDIRAKLFQDEPGPWKLVECDPNLAAKILLTGVEYAENLGFQPHRDFVKTLPYLQGLDPDLCPHPVITGRDGKPFYVEGPRDDSARILRHLDAMLGHDGYLFIAKMRSSHIFHSDYDDDAFGDEDEYYGNDNDELDDGDDEYADGSDDDDDGENDDSGENDGDNGGKENDEF